MSVPSFENRPRGPLRSAIVVSLSAANALLHRSTDSFSPFTRSSFESLLAGDSWLSGASTRGGACASPALSQHALLLSSVMWPIRRAHVRTAGVGCHPSLSAGNCSAALTMLFWTFVYIVFTSWRNPGSGAGVCCGCAGGVVAVDCATSEDALSVTAARAAKG